MSMIGNGKIALGLITRHLDDPAPILRFVDNAEKFGQSLDRVIVAYSHGVDPETVMSIEERINLTVVKASGDANLRSRLFATGLSAEEVDGLLDVPSWPRHQEIPYGAYRNAVLIQAFLDGLDYLLFFDSDIRPVVLTALRGDTPVWQEIDFVGRHMASLSEAQVAVTTSEYSGYYIIPPLSFDGLGDLLFGLGKGMALEYLEDCHEHGCLILGSASPGLPMPTDKPLGGNLGLSLDEPRRLAPFFSTIYSTQGRCIMSRGEDTLLGQTLSEFEGRMLDVDLLIFHDTYDEFPRIPDIHKMPVRDRFYRACLGWIGRNPFMTWYLDGLGRLATSFEAEINLQKLGLITGGERAAQFLDDPRFAKLSLAFDDSYEELPQAIDRYQRLMNGWEALLVTLEPEIAPREDDKRLPLAS
ncbi:MAG TPA: hypothetical protein VMX56_02690 [Anaerolineales bacterium]|nr:hypothetical protein [Anaerolineales bacterium]